MDKSPFQFKNSRLNLTLFQLYTQDTAILKTSLAEKIAQAPNLVGLLPVILDFSQLTPDKQSLTNILELIRSFKLHPVGCQGLSEEMQQIADDFGLPQLKSQVTPPPPPSASRPAPTNSGEIKLIRQVVRSGTQIHSSGDLIIVGAVAHGAEVLAEGNIIVYGPLRGRALAGIKGNTDAIVSCEHFDPELISIAGIYLLSEGINPDLIGDRVLASMTNDKMSFESL